MARRSTYLQSSFERATIEREPRKSVITANTTVSDLGYLYPVDTNGGTVTVTLASSMVSDGSKLVVKDEGGLAGTNAITIATGGSENIDGGTTATIGSNYGSMGLYSDGTNWFVKFTTSGGGTL